MRQIFRKLSRFFALPVLAELNQDSIADSIEVVSGNFSPGKLTLFSIFRDGIYFCKAFFDHYRKIGIEQFLILDDRSSDGTESFLRNQVDCVTLTSRFSFGEDVRYRPPNGTTTKLRAGTAMKSLIPHMFLQGSFALYADADEFLILPPEINNLSDVVDRMIANGDQAVVGPLVEFFPSLLSALQDDSSLPASFSDLIADSPHFEPTVLVVLGPDGTFKKAGRTKSEMLFEEFKIRRRFGFKGFSRRPTSPRCKTPILAHGPEAYRLGSHKVSVPVSSEIMLPMAHFVYTANFLQKIERACKWKSHAGRSAKYFYYNELADKLRHNGASLLGPGSRKFHSAQDLVETSLMKWP
jgi:hypothetical protein